MTDSRANLAPFVMLGACIACVACYATGLFGGFLLDDFGSLLQNPSFLALDGSLSQWLALAVSSSAGVLRRPISMLSFGVDYSLFGMDPLAFKSVNLAIHLLNGLLLYCLARRLLPRLSPSLAASNTRWWATACTALWLLHPLHVSNVLYVVQRMNLLSTAFTLLGLLAYCRARAPGASDAAVVRNIISLFACALLAVLSKENGALIFAYALVIEATCLRLEGATPAARRGLAAMFFMCVALPIVGGLLYLITHPAWIVNAYAGRSFSLVERLLSESRALCEYLLWSFAPLTSHMGIFHDDFAKSTGLLSPATTLISILFLCALVVIAWLLRRRAPGFGFAVAWFLVGQSMESTILPLELMFDHRQYLPLAGIYLGLIAVGAPFCAAPVRQRFAAIFLTVAGLGFAVTTAERARAWAKPLRLARAEAAHHPLSSRAQYELGRQIVSDGLRHNRHAEADKEAIPYFEHARANDPQDIFGVSSLIIVRGRNGGQVDEADVDDLAQRMGRALKPEINSFLVVLGAATDGNIKLSGTQVEKLVDTTLDNKVYPPTMRAMVLNAYAHYQFQQLHDAQAAVSLSLASVAEDPANPLFQLDASKLALALGNRDIALEHLNLAMSLDVSHIYTAQLEELRSAISQMTTQPKAAEKP